MIRTMRWTNMDAPVEDHDGDIFVGLYCVNPRNVFLFERYLKEKYEDEFDNEDDVGYC